MLERFRRRTVPQIFIGDGYECGKKTIMIEADVEIDRPLGDAKIGPGKHAEAQIDRGCIE